MLPLEVKGCHSCSRWACLTYFESDIGLFAWVIVVNVRASVVNIHLDTQGYVGAARNEAT